MAILNVTPDSFFAASRLMDSVLPDAVIDASFVVSKARQALAEGADILDIGGCSTRPGSVPVSEEEEWRRIEPALTMLRQELPDTPLSLDTFRPEIARRALERFGTITINDISGGCEAMFNVVKQFHAPYIWTLRGQLDLPAKHPEWLDLDCILDPGFGFIGSVEKDYECMRQMDLLETFKRPILVGVSRKSMLWKLLKNTPDECLSATQVLHLYALQHGATILRVHDVKEAAQTITLFEQLQ